MGYRRYIMKEEGKLVGIIEDIVGEARLVDPGKRYLQTFEENAPSFQPERRRFMRHAAVVVGGLALLACAHQNVQRNGDTYSGWEADLMTHDIIRGPPLMIHPETGLPSDFEHHRQRPINRGWGAVDYDVPIGTPIVPTAEVIGKISGGQMSDDINLYLVHRLGHLSLYGHLSQHTKNVENIIELGGGRISVVPQKIPVTISTIVAYSGNTGRGPGPSGYQPPHLHFIIRKIDRGQLIPPGLDPFKLGIDQKNPIGGNDDFGLPLGGRPVYWDGKTAIDLSMLRSELNRIYLLDETLDTLASRLKEELIKGNLEKEVYQEIIKRQNDPLALRDYIGREVLLKHPRPNGKPNYKYMPGSLMYALMLEIFSRTEPHDFIAMLPFIFPDPRVKIYYQKANPV